MKYLHFFNWRDPFQDEYESARNQTALVGMLRNCSLQAELDSAAGGTGLAFIVMAEVFVQVIDGACNAMAELYSAARGTIFYFNVMGEVFEQLVGGAFIVMAEINYAAVGTDQFHHYDGGLPKCNWRIF